MAEPCGLLPEAPYPIQDKNLRFSFPIYDLTLEFMPYFKSALVPYSECLSFLDLLPYELLSVCNVNYWS